MSSISRGGICVELLPYSIEKNLNIEEKKQYYSNILKYCKQLRSRTSSGISFGQMAISNFYMKNFYNNMLHIEGTQNIPNCPSIILCNHSTAHDIFSMYIAMEKLGIPTSVMVATDCLNPFSKMVFSIADSVFLDRTNPLSSSSSVLRASTTLLEGKSLVIFGESTWNLHPTKAMQDIKKGCSMISAITGYPVIPSILEYIEKPNIFDQESEIYKKIILRFGNAHEIAVTDDLSLKTAEFQKEMEQMRQTIWSENKIERSNISMIDPKIYINHTYLKKFKVFGFTYNSEYEAKFLRNNNGNVIENEYYISENNEFVPGITYKKRK